MNVLLQSDDYGQNMRSLPWIPYNGIFWQLFYDQNNFFVPTYENIFNIN